LADRETWGRRGKDAAEGGMLALYVEGEKTESRCMMERRAEPERHDAPSQISGGRKQGYQRRRYACPVCRGRENREQVHDGAESGAWSDMMHPAEKVEAAGQGCRRKEVALLVTIHGLTAHLLSGRLRTFILMLGI